MSNFNENTRVQVPAALHLCRLGYSYVASIEEGDFDPKTNVLTKFLVPAVEHLNPTMSATEVKGAIDELLASASNDDLGREFFKKITATSGVRFIDFDNPANNTWLCTTEFTCENPETHDQFRPDITCFVNGLPLAFVEVKRPNNAEGILAERDRINVRLRNPAFRSFLNVTQLMIFSNNQEYDTENVVPVQGSFYATIAKERAFFSVFREKDPEILRKSGYFPDLDPAVLKCILVHRNCLSIKEDAEFQTNQQPNTPTNRILTSMLSQRRFLFLLRYGFAYVERKFERPDGVKVESLEKHVMRYQQLFATFALREKLSKGVKSGIVWHTQGSGKTAFAYYNHKALTDFFSVHGTVPKFYFVVDRLDLLEQAADEFASRGLVVQTVDSREALLADIQDSAPFRNPQGKPEIMVVNIQKFAEDHAAVPPPPGYGTNLQRVFFVDEAHRGYNPAGSFLANLLEADRDAVKIALTGTPLLGDERASWRVFGDYIDTYYYDKSIADGYTLKLIREDIETSYREKISSIIERLAGNLQVQKKQIDRHQIVEHDSYLDALLDYILPDLDKFRVQQACKTAAAMIVCETNPQARELFRLFSDRNASGRTKLRPLLILHDEGDKSTRKSGIDEFKKTDGIDILIVNNMLLTGFDAPRLKRLYLCRKLDGHALLQALTRVNRPYRDFRYGYIVDFADIHENFVDTNNRYLQELRRVVDPADPSAPDPASVLLLSQAEIETRLQNLQDVLFSYPTEDVEKFRQHLDEEENKDALLALRRDLAEAKAILNQVRAFGSPELKAKVAALAPDSLPRLLAEVERRIDRINLVQNVHASPEIASIVNQALDEMEFKFRRIGTEELQFLYNDLRDRYQAVRGEFEANFDHKEQAFVTLSDQFRDFFRRRGFAPANVSEAKEAIGYMDQVMVRIKKINAANNALRLHYHGDERFVRIHKRIAEENARRTIPPDKPVISKREVEIMSNLNKIKAMIDERIWNGGNLVLENEPSFNQDVLRDVSERLFAMNIDASIEDRKFIRRHIAEEYLQRHRQLAG